MEFFTPEVFEGAVIKWGSNGTYKLGSTLSSTEMWFVCQQKGDSSTNESGRGTINSVMNALRKNETVEILEFPKVIGMKIKAAGGNTYELISPKSKNTHFALKDKDGGVFESINYTFKQLIRWVGEETWQLIALPEQSPDPTETYNNNYSIF